MKKTIWYVAMNCSLTSESSIQLYGTRGEALTRYNEIVEEFKKEVKDDELLKDTEYVDIDESQDDEKESWFSSEVICGDSDVCVRLGSQEVELELNWQKVKGLE